MQDARHHENELNVLANLLIVHITILFSLCLFEWSLLLHIGRAIINTTYNLGTFEKGLVKWPFLHCVVSMHAWSL
jgi:hypothetical protein